jgi:peptide/nickel transport system ATP-binding protein
MTVTETAAAGSVDDLTPTLQVEHLEVTHRVRGDDRRALRDVTFQIGRRESYGLVGESGSGKSTVALALTRYLPRNGRVTGGRISINGRTRWPWTPRRCAPCGPGRCRWCTRNRARR